MYQLVRNKKTKVKNHINTSTRDFNSQTQLQQLKAEELEQNKLHGVSTNTFSPFTQKKKKRRVEGRSFGTPAQSPVSHSLISLYLLMFDMTLNQEQPNVIRDQRLPVAPESIGSAKPCIH